MMYVVIRAGGVGTRLWPISRATLPKQFHALVEERTLLQASCDRLERIVPWERIIVSCSSQTAAEVQRQLPQLPSANILIEPALRDTAAAVGLETITIAKRDPQAIIASLGSDHSINDVEKFELSLRQAEAAITNAPDHIVCIGKKPIEPDTSYGYIELGETVADQVYRVVSFKEKPTAAVAEQFVATGRYLWNLNMFVWRADTILQLYQAHMPQMYEQLLQMQAHPEKIEQLYPHLEKVAVDYAIIEKAKHILAVAGQFRWNDIGDWARLKAETEANGRPFSGKADHIVLNSKNVFVHGTQKKVIAMVGVSNIVVVDTPDALLVCSLADSHKIKDLVKELELREWHDVL